MAGYQGYMVYHADFTAITGFPQPVSALLEQVPRGVFANGVERVALKRKLTWTFADLARGGISEAELLILTAARPSDGKVKIATWWPPEGATAAHWADCSAIWSPLSTVSHWRGRYVGVTITFSEVLAL